MNPDGSGVVNLTNNGGQGRRRRPGRGWSLVVPDGAKTVFDSTRNRTYEILSMDSAGGNATQLTRRLDVEPAWSPMGG